MKNPRFLAGLALASLLCIGATIAPPMLRELQDVRIRSSTNDTVLVWRAALGKWTNEPAGTLTNLFSGTNGVNGLNGTNGLPGTNGLDGAGVPLRGDGTNTSVTLETGTNVVTLSPTQTVASINVSGTISADTASIGIWNVNTNYSTNLHVTTIWDSLGTTGAVGQVLTATADGSMVYSNAGGVGEVTTAQLLTVSNQVDVSSNALQTALVANDTTTSNGVLTAAQSYADGLTNYTTLAAGSVTTGDLTVTNSLNIATQNVALLVVTNIQDSLGSTGSVGQVLTVMGSGGIAYSNPPAGDVSTAQLLVVSNQAAAKLDVTNGAAVTLSSTYLTGETNAPFRVLNSNGVAFVQVRTNGALVLSDPNLDDIDKDWWTVSSNGGWYLFGSSSGEMMRVSDLDEGMVFAPSYHIQANLVATTVLQTSAGAYFEMLNTTPSRVAILNGSQQLTNEPGTTLYDLIGTGAVTNGALTNTVWSKLSASTLDSPGSATLGSATVTGVVSAASLFVSNNSVSTTPLIHAGTNDLNGLTVSSNGNVGIGVTNPSVALQINGTIYASQFRGTVFGSTSAKSSFSDGSEVGIAKFDGGSSGTFKRMVFGIESDNWPAWKVEFATNNPTFSARTGSDGNYASVVVSNLYAVNVGVGITSNPAAALHVGNGGGLKVDGTNQFGGDAYFDSSIFLNGTNLNDHISAKISAEAGTNSGITEATLTNSAAWAFAGNVGVTSNFNAGAVSAGETNLHTLIYTASKAEGALSTNFAAGTANNVSNFVKAVSNRLDTFSVALTNQGDGVLQAATNFTLNAGVSILGNNSVRLAPVASYGTFNPTNSAFVGYRAGYGSSGSYNYGLGDYTLSSGSGNTNLAIGNQSGNSLAGDFNVFLGPYFPGGTRTNCVYVGLGASATIPNENNIFGVWNLNVNTTSLLRGDFLTGNVAIGTNGTPSSKLYVVGSTTTTETNATAYSLVESNAFGPTRLVYPTVSTNGFVVDLNTQFPLLSLTNNLSLLHATNRTAGLMKTVCLTVEPTNDNYTLEINSVWRKTDVVAPPTTLSNGYLYHIVVMGWGSYESNTSVSVTTFK